MPMIELLVCDDSDEARAALRTMLSDHEEIAIVGEAVNGEEASRARARAPARRRPDGPAHADRRRCRGDAADREAPAFDSRGRLFGRRRFRVGQRDDGGRSRRVLRQGSAALGARASDRRPQRPARPARARDREGVEPDEHRHDRLPRAARAAEAGAAAAYLGIADGGLSLAGCAGAARARRLASAPGLALEAFTTLTAVHAGPDDLRELAQLGLHCSTALAVPLVSDGEVLGSLLVTMPPDSDLVADEEFVADIAELAASAFASERRLALTHAEARRDALTGLANRRALDERLEAALREAAAVEQESPSSSSISTTSSASTTTADMRPATPCSRRSAARPRGSFARAKSCSASAATSSRSSSTAAPRRARR